MDGMLFHGTPHPGKMDEICAKKTMQGDRESLDHIERLRPSADQSSDSLAVSDGNDLLEVLSNGSDCEKKKTKNKNKNKKKRRLYGKGVLVATCGSYNTSKRNSSEVSDMNVGVPVGILVEGRSEKVCQGEENQLRRFAVSSHGSVSLCGRRRAMEDAVTVAPGLFFNLGKLEAFYDFFGVYDGHGGCGVAHVCRDRLHRLLVNEIEAEACGDDENHEMDWEKIMESCFSKMNDEISRRGIEMESMNSMGSTAVVALVSAEKLIVANCGDSRAVLSRGGVAVPLSKDHKPDRPDEMERVEAAGGRVINWNGYRVLGVLATSRSIGDQYLKPYVISVPEVTVTERKEEDEFLILASDGLWDVMSNDIACEVVRRCFASRLMVQMLFKGGEEEEEEEEDDDDHMANKCDAEEAAAMLVELAMARGSKDNISVVVVELKKKSR